MEIILGASLALLASSMVPLFRVAWEAYQARLKRQDRITVTVEGWDGKKATLTFTPDSEESISEFVEKLKAVRFGEKAIAPESPLEEHRAASTEAAY